ncbi:MAG: hypothetical protein ACODAC_10400 [Pseudomonadota bacterium]
MAAFDVDLEMLANLGEFLSALVVILSLIYLARQIRQNTGAQRNQNYAVALERISELQARMSQQSEFADMLVIGTNDPSRLSRQQRVQFTWAFYEMFGSFEFIFLQARSGAMPDAVWRRWGNTLQWWLSFPGVQLWWQSRPTPFTEPFTELVDSLLTAGLPDPAGHERWVTFLMGERVAQPARTG